MTTQSAVDFPGNSRVHIALAVTDLDRSLAFYEVLLGLAPTKVRPGYVKFEPLDPSLNLTLNEVSDQDERGKPATHYGVQVKSTDTVRDAIARFAQAGLTTSVEENTTCCYAVQDKVWVSDPDGNQWEVFVVTEADATANAAPDAAPAPDARTEPTSACCDPAPAKPSA